MESTDPDTNGVDTTPDTAPDPAAAITMLRDLFSTLVPPSTVRLMDCLGNEHLGRAILPARAQVIMMQRLQELWEQPTGITGLMGSDGAGLVGTMISLASDSKVLDGMCDAFAAAHPRVLADAIAASDTAGDKHTHPADLFPLEELAIGLAPFFIRFAARSSDLMGQVLPSPMPAQA